MADNGWVAEATLNEIESPLEFLVYSVSKGLKEIHPPSLPAEDKQRVVDAVCGEVRARLQEALA